MDTIDSLDRELKKETIKELKTLTNAIKALTEAINNAKKEIN